MSIGSFPYYLISEVRAPEKAIHQYLEIVRCCGVAVEINAACRFENAMHFDKALSHHAEIGGHALAVRQTSRIDYGKGRRVAFL